MTIGIVGAGICGLMAAHELKKHGYDVWLVESASEVGGRMATLYMGEAVFDLGAQFFTSRSQEFSTIADEMRQAEIVREWFRGYPSNEHKKTESYPRFCGARGMVDIAKFLADGFTIHLNRTVTEINIWNEKWHVTAGGDVYEANVLILTLPVPQALEIINTSKGFNLPGAQWREQLSRISYEPCWAVLVQLDGPGRIPSPGALHIESGPLSWIADNYQKGISPLPGNITIHARGDWSNEHVDDVPETVIEFLLNAARDYLGANVISARTHLWRYAKPLVTHDKPYIHLSYITPLFFAGDAFVTLGAGPRLESAALSGLAAARALHELYEQVLKHRFVS